MKYKFSKFESLCCTLETYNVVHAKAPQSCLTLCDPHGLYPSRLICPWDSPGMNTGVSYCALLHAIFPTQELNPYLWHLLHCKQFLYPLNHLGSPLAH